MKILFRYHIHTGKLQQIFTQITDTCTYRPCRVMSLCRYSFSALVLFPLIQSVLYESKINFEVNTFIPFQIMIYMKQRITSMIDQE